MKIALFQPEIAQNVGTIIRLGACFGIPIDIIEPIGFPWNNTKMKRAGMDYLEIANVTRYPTFEDFLKQKKSRIIVFDLRAENSYLDIQYNKDDILLFGQESNGIPEDVYCVCDECAKIPMVKGTRSLNLAASVAIGSSEALRQTNTFP